MCRLTVLGSSSKGNAYILTCGEQHLLIECGVPFKQVLKTLNYKVEGIVGCIVSHRHKDHAGYIKQYKDYAINVYSNSEVPNTITLIPKQSYNLNGFKITPIKVPHGDCENYAYIIEHEECGRVLFCTDAEDFPYNISNITSIIIEANYSEDLLVEALMENKSIHSQSHTHMEIETTASIIKRLSSPQTLRVILIHLSDEFSNERVFKRRIADVPLFVEVFTANKGMVIDMNKTLF